LTTLLLSLGLVLLTGCASPGVKAPARDADILTADTILKPATPIATDDGASGISISPRTDANRPPPKPEIEVGTAKFYTPQPTSSRGGGEGQVTFNFENQPVQAVVKAILGDMLEENYTIAPNVGGNVTYSTSKPIRREDAMPVLEMLLSWTGNALVRDGNRYMVLQSKDAIAGKLTPRVGATQQPGYSLRIFPLSYISASEMAKLLKPYAKPDAFVSIDPNRSLLVMAGNPSELDNYQRTIDTFDVDWLKGMSVGVFTMQHVEVTKLMPDLDALFGSKGESPLAGMFRFMPIEQTNAMIVITPQPEYLKQAEEWLRRLDRGGAENSVQLYVYNVKNLKAPDLADYLSQIFLGTASSGSHRSSTSGSVGQGFRPVTIGGIGGRGGNGGSGGMNYNSRQPAKEEKVTPAASTPAASGGNKDSDIRISAIEENNQLMIQATPVEWDSIESAIKKLDVVPLQVQIEARVLEVQLSGALQYGVQWWFAGLQGQSPRYANGDPYRRDYDRHQSLFGAAGPGQGGNIFWSYLNKNFEVALSALESKGQAKALAAPSLLVANNQEAQINVGTQLPVVQQYVTGLGIGTTNSGNAVTPGYGSVQYLNTGVTLAVTPRVNPGGLVYLDVQQEVSSPGIKAANGNPQINQRQLQTQVAVQSGETLLLGGLIQETSHVTDTGVPFLNRVPILRNLFGSTDTARDRTELIVLITPRVISTVDEARAVTADYARQFESLKPLRPTFAPKPAAQAAPPEPAQTYPAHDDAKPQEDHPNDN
jgi:general secretion pathway protein D